jgi:hypothetical protein
MTRIVADGFRQIEQYLSLLPDRAKQAASLAINQTATRKGMATLRENMREEIAFPAGYLEKKNRLGVTKFAKPDDLEGIITGRDRPTSLARFASGAPGGRSRVSLRVNPGRTQTLSSAFLVRLRAGQGPVTDDAFNLGLAIRLRKGERISNKREMVPFAAGLYLLYGPSVDQVFRTVAASAAPEIADLFVDEFRRQFARLGRE